MSGVVEAVVSGLVSVAVAAAIYAKPPRFISACFHPRLKSIPREKQEMVILLSKAAKACQPPVNNTLTIDDRLKQLYDMKYFRDEDYALKVLWRYNQSAFEKCSAAVDMERIANSEYQTTDVFKEAIDTLASTLERFLLDLVICEDLWEPSGYASYVAHLRALDKAKKHGRLV